VSDLTSPSFVASARCSVRLLEAASGSAFRQYLLEIKGARTQAVFERGSGSVSSGNNIDLVFDLVPTTCSVSAPADAACQVLQKF
jgi:hypothetical protein